MKKCFELHEQLRQRMGCVVVGPSGAGKTTLWRVLRAALISLGQQVNLYTVNPKSMPRQRVGLDVLTILNMCLAPRLYRHRHTRMDGWRADAGGTLDCQGAAGGAFVDCVRRRH
jgi:ABC-type Na+ transport system ATPase subunit NatA